MKEERKRGLKDGGGLREGGTDRHDFIAANWWRGSTRERSDGPTKNVGPWKIERLAFEVLASSRLHTFRNTSHLSCRCTKKSFHTLCFCHDVKMLKNVSKNESLSHFVIGRSSFLCLFFILSHSSLSPPLYVLPVPQDIYWNWSCCRQQHHHSHYHQNKNNIIASKDMINTLCIFFSSMKTSLQS